MTRTMTTSAEAAVGMGVVRPVLLAKFEFDSGDLCLCSADRNIVFSGDTYYGVGNMGEITGIKESSDLQASGVSMALSGIPPSLVALVLAEPYQGRTVTVYEAFLDSTYALITDPVTMFVGMIDQMTIAMGETATINVTAENELIRWERPNIRRYTDADQRTVYSTDMGLQYVSQTVEKELIWGRPK